MRRPSVFAADSALEGAGFEISVPRLKSGLLLRDYQRIPKEYLGYDQGLTNFSTNSSFGCGESGVFFIPRIIGIAQKVRFLH